MKINIGKLLDLFKENKKSKILLVVSILIILLLLLSDFFVKDDDTQKNVNEIFSSTQYIDDLENKLEDIVSSISGAGKCKIMITLDTGEESIYAKQSKNESEDKNESSKSSDEFEYVILKNSSSKENGMLLKVVEPNVRGVAIVCEGGDKATVKEDIICAVSSVLDIKSNQISITKMKAN